MMEEEPLSPKKGSNVSSQFITVEFIQKLKELEGQCRMKEVMYLRINYLKAIILTTLLTLSVFGLILLKYFIKLRAKVFYSTVSFGEIDNVTHVYVIGQEKEEEISKVQKVTYDDSQRKIFEFKKLNYQIYQDRPLPVGFPYIGMIGRLRREPFLKQGLPSIYVSKRQQFYGKNEHRVEVPGYFEFIFDTMTTPFFIFQYLVSIIYILQNTAVFGVLMIVFGFITTSVNYVLLKRSYNKIKQTAQKLFKVKVFRNGIYQEIDNIDIVPGDLFEPAGQIPCDSIVVKGELFVDQCNLTGENVPIAKFKIIDDAKHSDKTHWLFEGSKVQTVKEHTLALAVNVGYASQRGRIIRKILNKVSKQPQFFKKLIYFQLEVMLISFIIYFVSLPQLLSLDIDTIMVFFRFFDFITYSFPAPFPIFFNLAYSFCLVRLNKQDITGTQPEKTVESSRMKTICFDKTGTLTINRMEISNVFHFEKNDTKQITNQITKDGLVSQLFACCNSVQLINGQVKGDEIDLRMFDFVNGKLFPSKSANIVREVQVNGQKIEIVKINQYQSQFQSMSVIVREPNTGKHYVYAKGSPQMIHHYSIKKINNFDNFVKKLSFSGYRSIGFGYKQIKEDEIEGYLLKGREEFLLNTNILGVVTFINQLKADARSTISTLAECDINTKIITGDNIFLGVQTAIVIGMIPPLTKITVIQGKRYNKQNNSVQALNLFKNEKGQIEENTQNIADFHYQNDTNHYYAIDNDFIKMNPQNFLHDKVKVFARISPQNKALIVRRHKQKNSSDYSRLTFTERLLKECSYKVGMVGDGANDLISIKEAHVGIGISSSDAVFSASFAIRQLQQILQIIKQSKSTQRQIIQMTKYYGLSQFSSIIATLILSTDSSYFTSLQLVYKNFLITLIIPVFIGMSKQAKQMTKYLNNSNLFDLQNHLVFWTTIIIYAIGLITSYVQYSQSPDFVANTHTSITFESGWYGQAPSSTFNFITTNIMYISLPFAIYRSSPWKSPIWTNRPVTVCIIINIALLVLISLLNSQFGFLGLTEVPVNQIIILWVIMLTTSATAIFVNKFIQKVFFTKMIKRLGNSHNQYEEKQLKNQT